MHEQTVGERAHVQRHPRDRVFALGVALSTRVAVADLASSCARRTLDTLGGQVWASALSRSTSPRNVSFDILAYSRQCICSIAADEEIQVPCPPLVGDDPSAGGLSPVSSMNRGVLRSELDVVVVFERLLSAKPASSDLLSHAIASSGFPEHRVAARDVVHLLGR